MDTHKIYVLQLQTNTMPAKLIRVFTRYQYSHIALSLDESCHTTYSFGRRNLYNTFDAGFVVEEKDGEFFKRFDRTTCRIYELEVSDKQYKELKNIIHYMMINADDFDYDFLGIVLRFFGIEKTFENKYVCSYFIADLLERATIYKFNKPNCLVEPRDFEAMTGAKMVYEGSYHAMESVANI